MKTYVSPEDLLELRFLQQRRIEYTDGWNWLRIVVGVVLAAVAVIGLAVMLPESRGVNRGLYVAALMFVGYVFLAGTVSWIIRSDKCATQARISELQSAT